MDTAHIRPIPIDQHPLKCRTYRMPTPAIAAFRDLVDECLFLFVTGAMVSGQPRNGKTYAIEFLCRDLVKRYPKLSIYKLRCKKEQAPSENRFFSNLLTAANHAVPVGASRAALRGRLIHKLRQVAEQRGDPRIVLFADEAQNLREIEYEWLRDVHDELELQDLRLFVFLVGQPQLLAQKSAFQALGKEQIVARFMVEEQRFRGVCSAEDCAAILATYDRGEYPAGSGWTYTRFFLPEAYGAGLRLAQEAGRLWGAFEDAHIRANLDGALEIPMKYFTTAIEAALLLNTGNDSARFAFSDAGWARTIEKSRYVAARRAGASQRLAIVAP
jgi:hypothetical protein